MNMKKVRWTFDGEAENKRVGCRTHGFRPILNSQFSILLKYLSQPL